MAAAGGKGEKEPFPIREEFDLHPDIPKHNLIRIK